MNRAANADHSDQIRTTAWVVAGLTVVGAILRGWHLDRLGLTHFDEGIYALAGSWALSPGGLSALSSNLIPYAPPGFVLLVGALYTVIGPSDLAAIAVSLIVGTVTIPVVAWLAWRTFGPDAGMIAAALATFSGPHIAFSRMALTDALFLIVLLLTIGVGQRFLERPGVWRGILLGLAVGLAQQCKYNGWLSGGIVALAALFGIIMSPDERRPNRWARAIGWGLLAVIVSSLIVWPWFRFVDHHGGYGALLRHQRSYLGGASAWWPNLRTQCEQSIALSGGSMLRLAPWLVAGGAFLYRGAQASREMPLRGRIERGELLLGVVLYFLLFWNAMWWVGLAMLPVLIRSHAPAARVIGTSWLIFSILSPFYHPYARLWLPLHALGWIMTGGLVAGLSRPFVPTWTRAASNVDPLSSPGFGRKIWLTWWIGITALLPVIDARTTLLVKPLDGLFASSDSLRKAVDHLVLQVPDEVSTIRLLTRPPVTFYLAGRKAVWLQENLESLARPEGSGAWALYDTGLGFDSTSGVELPAVLKKNWDVVAYELNTLSLPALLDIHPDTARSEADATHWRQTRLWLLRPSRAGGRR